VSGREINNNSAIHYFFFSAAAASFSFLFFSFSFIRVICTIEFESRTVISFFFHHPFNFGETMIASARCIERYKNNLCISSIFDKLESHFLEMGGAASSIRMGVCVCMLCCNNSIIELD